MPGFVNKNKQKRLKREQATKSKKHNYNVENEILKVVNATNQQQNNKQINKHFFKNVKSEERKSKKPFNFYSKYKLILLGSLLVFGLSIYNCFKVGFNKGIDFAGGIVVEVACQNCKVREINNELQKQLGLKISYQEIDGGYIFKTASTDKNYDKIIKTFRQTLSQNKIKITHTDYVSAQMSNDFIKDSIIACIFAFVCIGLYIIIRFNWRFSISGIITLIFDVVVVLSCVSALNIEVCLIILTALLTIIGYCINDKIVVFDRIRSNLFDTAPVVEIVKTSVKSVLTRSVLTSLTTIITTISLLFFGDRSIYELGLTIICGIVFGTISSLVVAPSILLLLKLPHSVLKQQKDDMWYAS